MNDSALATPVPHEPTNTWALVELCEAERLADERPPADFNRLCTAFEARLQDCLRADDQCRMLQPTRAFLLFRNLSTPALARLVIAKLERLFERPIEVGGGNLIVQIRMGVVAASDQQPQDALADASVALGLARRNGSRFEIYTPEQRNQAVDEACLLAELERAVEHGELHLYYQPKVHANYGNLVGAEALMRWHRPDRTIMSPAQFIEVAERHPVIRPLSWFALKSAISRCSGWPDPLSVAVNIPPTLLLDDEICAVIVDLLDIHGLDPQRLTIEVTESVMVDNQVAMFEQLARIREIGARVAIDDFGTGYSSLAYFRDLPADELKIDKSFVLPMLESKRDATIVKTVIDLAHNFSLRVVAEGVESKVIAARLKQLGCDVLQGYAFDRPLSVETFESRYKLRKQPQRPSSSGELTLADD